MQVRTFKRGVAMGSVIAAKRTRGKERGSSSKGTQAAENVEIAYGYDY